MTIFSIPFLVSFILVEPYRVVNAQLVQPVETRGPFLGGPEKPWQTPKQFYCKAVFSLYSTCLRYMYLSVFKYRLTKNGFSGLKRFRGYRKMSPKAKRAGGKGIRSFSITEKYYYISFSVLTSQFLARFDCFVTFLV